MILLDPAALPEEPAAARALRLVKRHRVIGRADSWFKLPGLARITPVDLPRPRRRRALMAHPGDCHNRSEVSVFLSEYEHGAKKKEVA